MKEAVEFLLSVINMQYHNPSHLVTALFHKLLLNFCQHTDRGVFHRARHGESLDRIETCMQCEAP